MNLSLAYLLYDNPSKDLSEKDYYSGGMVMPGRNYQSLDYRFSFNGKEDDTDANIGYQDYGLRFYDKRLGRFFSVDPLTKDYPWYSPYQFAGNSPIGNIDRDGAEPKSYMDELIWGDETTTKWQYTVYTVYDNLTEQYHTIMNRPNSANWFYWQNNDGSEGQFTGQNKDENGNWSGRWMEYKTTERVRQENMYAFADFGQKTVAGAFMAIGTMGFSLEAGTATALIGFGTRYAGLKGVISALTQLAAHKQIDAIDVAGDAVLGKALGNATLNTTLSLGYDFEKREFFGSVAPLDAEYAANFANTVLWGAAGNASMNTVSPLIREGLERVTMETLTTLPTTVGEEGIQEAIETK
ncbi:MAG: hypothetical protein IPG01_09755 [Chitinophagaceae bacterium]|nr:hypothetical protein [Chitinophagaceae bacterium]